MKSLFGESKTPIEDSKYSKRILIPQYEPVNDKPLLCELFDLTQYSKLLRNINISNILDEEKEFLKFAASRHIVFNYARIADYYANATPEMQKLMEQSALVIIDPEDAIANGYVKFSNKVLDMLKESGENTNEEYKQ